MAADAGAVLLGAGVVVAAHGASGPHPARALRHAGARAAVAGRVQRGRIVRGLRAQSSQEIRSVTVATALVYFALWSAAVSDSPRVSSGLARIWPGSSACCVTRRPGADRSRPDARPLRAAPLVGTTGGRLRRGQDGARGRQRAAEPAAARPAAGGHSGAGRGQAGLGAHGLERGRHRSRARAQRTVQQAHGRALRPRGRAARSSSSRRSRACRSWAASSSRPCSRSGSASAPR